MQLLDRNIYLIVNIIQADNELSAIIKKKTNHYLTLNHYFLHI